MDLNDIRKTIRDFEKKAKGLIDNITKKIVSENISDGLAPYMNKGAKGEQRKANRTPLVEDATEEIMSKYVFITIEETDEVWYYRMVCML
jgi:transcription antitermination factor NusG